MKVGYLGPKGTFSYEACSKHFSDQDEKIPYKTIKETIKALLNDDVEMCIVPIENSLQGCVVETIDTLIKFDNLYVISEEILKINQKLIHFCVSGFFKCRGYAHDYRIDNSVNYLEIR